MKKLLLIAIAFFTLNAMAQEKQAKATSLSKETKVTSQNDQAEALANNETKKLTKQLDLSLEQQKKIHQVMLQHYKQRLQKKQQIKKMLVSKKNTSKEETKKAIASYKKGQSEKLNSQIKQILTEQQYVSYLENIKIEKKAMVKKN